MQPLVTKKQKEQYATKFKDFLQSKNLSSNIETVPVNILSNYLSYFYFSLRSKKGDMYSPSTLICIGASIQRYLNGPEIDRKLNIINEKTSATITVC